MMKLATAALAVIAASVLAQATTVTWTGFGPDNLWSTALNWDLNRVPGPQDDVVLHNGTCVANNYVAVQSVTMGDRLESKASLTILNTFFVSNNFQSFSNGDVSLTSGASALSGVFVFKGGFTFQSGSVSGTVTASGTTDMSGEAAKTITTGSLTISGTSTVAGVVSLDGTKPLFTVSGSSSWSLLHLMPTQNATQATFDASAGSVNIAGNVALQADGKFGALTLVNGANLTIYSNVKLGSALNVPTSSFVSTIGSAVVTLDVTGNGTVLAAGSSTIFNGVNFNGMIGCSGALCKFAGKSTVGNLVGAVGSVEFAQGSTTQASIFSISKAQVQVTGLLSVAQFNLVDGGQLAGTVSATKLYVRNSNSFNLNGAIDVTAAGVFDGAQINFLEAGSIRLSKTANSMVTGILSLGGMPAAPGVTNNGQLQIRNLFTSQNINLVGTGSISLSSILKVNNAQLSAGVVTMKAGSSVSGKITCVNVASFSAAAVKAKIDDVSYTCQGGCTDISSSCTPLPTDSFSFSA
jgi:hypothetical protein